MNFQGAEGKGRQEEWVETRVKPTLWKFCLQWYFTQQFWEPPSVSTQQKKQKASFIKKLDCPAPSFDFQLLQNELEHQLVSESEPVPATWTAT